MRRYKIVQTGPKSQLGGLNPGLIRVVYQVDMERTVKIEPINPAIWQITTEIINNRILFMMRKKSYAL
jgi:hypothetical protein